MKEKASFLFVRCLTFSSAPESRVRREGNRMNNFSSY
jgi:hypothetical protein